MKDIDKIIMDELKDIYEEGAQNRFRNNDYRSFEEWLESKEDE